MYENGVYVWILRCSVFVGLLSAVVTVIYLTPIPELQHASCLRPCHELDWPMICRVKLVLEVSSAVTMSRSFSGHNSTECVEGCVGGGGGIRTKLLTANGQSPGPTIEVCEKDILVVDVINRAPGAAVSVHWRGQDQKETPYMDGAPMVTQCPINTFTTFQYKFRATNPGTHIWQVHTGNPELDSLFGALIVRQSRKKEPHHDLYDEDGHFVLISTSPSTDNTGSGALLINGKPFGQMGLAQFNVTSYKRHRLRVMYAVASMSCPVSVAVESHSLLVIALDGHPIQPVETLSIVIAPGERVDAVLTADQELGNYQLTVSTSDDCKARLRGSAVVSYQTHQSAQSPLTRLPHHQPSLLKGLSTVGDGECSRSDSQFLCLSKIQSLVKVPSELTPERLPFTLFLPFDFVKPPPQYTVFDDTVRMPRLNNLTLTFPSSPLLSQPDLQMCNSNVRPLSCENSAVCQCVHVVDVPLHTPVELVLIDQGGEGSHTFHLHGHSFHVVGVVGRGEIARWAAKWGRLPRHLHNPIVKDTVTVPSGGAVALRFKADNPGFWLLHDERWQGLGVIFHVGSPGDTPAMPDNFPTCGDFVGPEFFLI
nr:multicopper oxidase related protein [Nephotettix cincticeps]